MKRVITKRCPICNLDLPIDAFGFCRARKDGRNLYCKSCICKKVTASRHALREYTANKKRRVVARIEAQPEIATERYLKLAPVDKVRLAIQRGARTQAEIGRVAKLYKDDVCDALAILLLWNHEVRSMIVGDDRIYLPVRDEVERKPCKPSIPLMEFAMQLGPRARVKAA